MKAWVLLPAVLAASSAPAQELGVGRQLAATCATCHGTQGRAVGSVIPPLAGMKAEVLLSAMADYRQGRQPGTVMPQIAKGYTEEQLRLIAAYFAAQPAPAPASRP
ncbi:c-type cytochrome [Roseateles puraquae]|jgi:cytochrome c553|uniref:Cytochrome C n=1 Tax=Roseateles puraquae TaxID=431059 RepID=A0A254N0M9_9BURK|nr:c-type cytochrome [Roseateles puraquae]MDG0855455.1 c-type cytochrome [Roseateles puraquae]OWR01855.1 cytochrome C [Roseateles puraquae]